MNTKVGFKNDRFKKNRGNSSRWLLLSCEKCKTPFCFYQKDGPGILKRLYLDRMTSVKNEVIVGKDIVCNNCKNMLGVYTIYEKEDRPAYRLFSGTVVKKIIKKDDILKTNINI